MSESPSSLLLPSLHWIYLWLLSRGWGSGDRPGSCSYSCRAGCEPIQQEQLSTSSCEAANQLLSWRQKLFLGSTGPWSPGSLSLSPVVALFQDSDNSRASAASPIKARCQGPLWRVQLYPIKGQKPPASSDFPKSSLIWAAALARQPFPSILTSLETKFLCLPPVTSPFLGLRHLSVRWSRWVCDEFFKVMSLSSCIWFFSIIYASSRAGNYAWESWETAHFNYLKHFN